MALLLRLVREVQVIEGGRLVGAGVWNLAPARGERRLHLQLVALAGASDAAIARFASSYGRLGHKVAAYIHAVPPPYWERQSLRLAQARWAELDQAAAWARGQCRHVPAGAADLQAWLAHIASVLPTSLLTYMVAVFRGDSPPPPTDVTDDDLREAVLPV